MAQQKKKFPIENIEENVYNNILEAAFKDAKQHFPKNVYSKQNPQTGEFTDGRSINDFATQLNNLYQHLDKNKSTLIINPKLNNTAIASAKAVQIIYNLCVENELNNSIENVLETPEFAAQANEHTRKELKNRVREFLDSGNITENDKKLAESIRTSFNKHNGGQNDYIYNAFNYIEELNHNICELNIEPDTALNVSEYKRGTPVRLNQEIASDLRSAFKNYSEEKGDAIKVSTVYVAGQVNPLEFLKHYNESPASISQKERDFATNFLTDIEFNLNAQKTMTNNGSRHYINFTDYTSDGQQIISEDEKEQLRTGNLTASDLECKIVAEILSGKDVCAKTKGSTDAKIHIEPQIICKDPEGFIDFIIQYFKDLFTKGRDKKEINAANERYSSAAEKNKDTYEEISFDELVGKDSFDKLTKKPAVKQNEKEKENEMDTVIIGR